MRIPRLIALTAVALLGLLTVGGRARSAEPPSPISTGTRTAALFFAKNDFVAAREAFAAAVKQEPDSALPRLGLLRSLLRLDDWEAARDAGTEAVAKFPDDGDLRGLYALALLRAGRIESAIAEAKKAQQLEPFGFYALLAYGRTELFEGNTQRARASFRRALEVRPDDADAWLGRFEASDDSTEEQEDLFAARKYLALNPKGFPHDREADSVANIVKNWKTYKFHYEKDDALTAIAPYTEKELRRRERSGGSFEVRIKFKERLGFVVVPVTVDGATFELIYDSGGGNGLLLTASAAKRLAQTKARKVAQAMVRGASGSETTVQYKAERMQIGGLTLAAIPIDTVGEKPGLGDGIIGGPALDAYAVTLDFTTKELILRRGKDARAPQPADGNYTISETFRYHGGKILLPLRAAEIPIWSIVDSGSSVDIFSLRLARSLSKDLPKERIREGSQPLAVGVGNTESKMQYLLFPERMTLRFGHDGGKGSFYQPTSMGLSILDTQISPAMGVEISFLLGMPTLRLYERVTFDYPRRLLTLEAKAPSG